MPGYFLYHVSSGLIVQYMEVSERELFLYETTGRAAIPTTSAANLSSLYVLDGVATPRPSLTGFDKTAILADGADTAILSGLPNPCTILINGQEHIVTGGTLELDADYPGTYRVEIRHFPYRDFVQEIIAT